ncbi:hypothetical protein NDU88_011466 [Pleurodeles waltl]|uniref:Uncharacterized protein n=1 Tax=Pleurodeles waltl TaxID=8319 RepID=A0AAV7S700_PLEWA|nr:hypothetical protein NDU88_011466 [Pleurodeles waltl]
MESLFPEVAFSSSVLNFCFSKALEPSEPRLTAGVERPGRVPRSRSAQTGARAPAARGRSRRHTVRRRARARSVNVHNRRLPWSALERHALKKLRTAQRSVRKLPVRAALGFEPPMRRKVRKNTIALR